VVEKETNLKETNLNIGLDMPAVVLQGFFTGQTLITK
jgi:hypothetical protein